MYVKVLITFITFTSSFSLNEKASNNSFKSPLIIKDKLEGLLIGSLIGDAAGGPHEFNIPIVRSHFLKNNDVHSSKKNNILKSLFKLSSYTKKAAPYAHWVDNAPAGSVTDDSRFKIIFFDALKRSGKICPMEFAKSLIFFEENLKKEFRALGYEWLKEFKPAALWQLGFSENQGALPPDRMWAGIPTMVGQMPFLPIATLFPGDPESAYLKTWHIDFLDSGFSKDIQAAIVAGLASAFCENSDWKSIENTMRAVDPYKFGKAKYVKRRLNKWLDFSHEAVKRSEGNVKKLFDILESEMNAHQYWEAWVPLVVVFSCAEIVNYEPIPAMQLVIEFGHDTDSYGQLMGAFMGAIHGKDIFPSKFQYEVKKHLKNQYNEDFENWIELILETNV